MGSEIELTIYIIYTSTNKRGLVILMTVFAMHYNNTKQFARLQIVYMLGIKYKFGPSVDFAAQTLDPWCAQ